VSQPLSTELSAFVESGLPIQVGTADARGRPDGARCFGVFVAPGGAELTVWVGAPMLGEIARNLRENPRVAVCVSRPSDHRTIQVKGRLLELRDAIEEDRIHVDRYRAATSATLAEIGVPPRVFLAVVTWPATAIRMAVEEIYVQTPGPGAGARLGAPEGAP
jgi:predicted pyridoxine 5'-phosphate oxidase superfamily flavin-nucleotide-binding protein